MINVMRNLLKDASCERLKVSGFYGVAYLQVLLGDKREPTCHMPLKTTHKSIRQHPGLDLSTPGQQKQEQVLLISKCHVLYGLHAHYCQVNPALQQPYWATEMMKHCSADEHQLLCFKFCKCQMGYSIQ